MPAPFRFGHQLRPVPGGVDELLDAARDAERAGFDVVCVPDHVGPGLLSPLPTLAAIASATERIRLGTYVLNIAMRNPVQLAWEAVSLDHVSDGRLELGLGAGHTPHEFTATGVARHTAAERKGLLMRQVEVLRRLLDGETVTGRVGDLELSEAHVGRSVQASVPILVGGNGERLLAHAGSHADIIGLQGLGRTLEDGHRHEVRWTNDHLERQLEQIRVGTGGVDVELNALVQIVDITDDADRAIGALCAEVDGLTVDDVIDTPYVLIGTVDEIVAKLLRLRDRWGISYFTVRAGAEMAPIIDAVRGR